MSAALSHPTGAMRHALAVQNRSLRLSPAVLEASKPVLRAYALAYLSAITPRIFSYLKSLGRKDQDARQKLYELRRVLLGPLKPNKFPAFCAFIVGGSGLLATALRRIFLEFLKYRPALKNNVSAQTVAIVTRLVATFVASWCSFDLLNNDGSRPLRARVDEFASLGCVPEDTQTSVPTENGLKKADIPPLSGKTLDLTLFTVLRAADVVVGLLWGQWASRREASGRLTWLDKSIARLTDAGVFAASASIVMWAWIYLPERLPRSYNMWISEAAQIDGRLIEALRRARRGQFFYGKDTGQAPLLEGMCEKYHWPLEWADPSKTIPLPCEMVHMGTGHSCEMHALSRFLRAFKFAMLTYLPLQLAMKIRSNSLPAMLKAIKNAIRSSVFLGSFISMFYYSVCLARTRLGPKIFSRDTVTPQMWDSGLCIGAGCLMCGWSILIENRHKRQEIAFFVATRALAALVPRRYDRQFQWRENLAFATSTAVVFTCVKENPDRVRGVLGRVLGRVLNGKQKRL